MTIVYIIAFVLVTFVGWTLYWFITKSSDKTNNVEKIVQELIPKVRTKKLESYEADLNLTKTNVKLTFGDGHVFNTIIYGRHTQRRQEGWDESIRDRIHGSFKEPEAEDFNLISSVQVAEYFIVNELERKTSFSDDPNKPRIVQVGQVIQAEILDTQDHYEKVTIYRVVDK